MTTDDRQAVLERLRRSLDELADEASGCTEDEWVDRVLWAAAVAMVEVAGWDGPGFTKAAWTVDQVFQRAEFADVAANGVRSLPEREAESD